MFFSGLFGGFERCGSPPAPRLRRAGAAFPSARWRIRGDFLAAAGGEEIPRENSERRRSRTADNFKFFFGGIQLKIRKANTK